MSSLLDMIADDDQAVPGLVTAAGFLETFRAERPERMAFDTESPTYKWMLPDADPFALTFSWRKERTYYVDCSGDDAEAAAYALYEVLATVPVLVCHNLKYDLHVAKRLLTRFGLPLVTRLIDDTMLLDCVLDEQRYHGLKERCAELDIRFSDEDADAKKDEIETWRQATYVHTGVEPGFDEVPKRIMVPYARQDAYLTLELFGHLRQEMEHQLEAAGTRRNGSDLADIYALELGFLWVAFNAEERGIRVDMDFVGAQMAELADRVEAMRRRLNEALPFDMNPGSTDDVAQALVYFGHADALWTNPRTGKVNLPEWRLEQLANDAAAGDLVKSVLEYRTSAKMLNSYFEVLAKESKRDEIGQWIVRCSIKTIGARTGRTSITEPALQTIPRDKGEVRGAFIAREGHKLVFADWQGQELRLLGHYLSLVGDDSICEVFSDPDADLHMESAVAIFDKLRGEVTKEERRVAKNINFAIVYGAGAKKVGYMVGARNDSEAQIIGRTALNRIYRRFPGLPRLKKACEVAMLNREYVITHFGRRHREKDGSYAYKAVNSLVQGSGADLAKTAAVRVDEAFRQARMRSKILLLVHDELMVEAPDEEVDAAAAMLRDGMTDFDDVRVPLEVDLSVTTRWSEK